MRELPKRKLNRLRQYDYANEGYYFVTICTQGRKNIFVGNGLDRSVYDACSFTLGQFGEIARDELLKIPGHFDGVAIDQYCIMPNHIHAIIVIGCDGKTERSRPFPTLCTVVGLYKSGVSKAIHRVEPHLEVWQKSYHDHIIRNDEDYREIWQYIDENPLKWTRDRFYNE